MISISAAAADPWKQAAELAGGGKFGEAAEAYSKLIVQQPEDMRGYLGRGRALLRMNRPDAAIADFDKAIALNPKNAGAYNSRALAHHKAGRNERALQDHDKAIELDPNLEVHWFNRGLTWMAMKEWEKSLADFNKAIELDPGRGDTYRMRANVFTNRGECGKAIADCDKAIELSAKDAEAYYYRANAAAKLGGFQKALADFDRAIELSPKVAVFHNNRGTLLRNRGENDGALESFETAIKLDPDSGQYVSNRGVVWLNKGQLEKALADFDKAIQLNSKDATAYRRRAGCRLARGEFEQAVADATMSIELMPSEDTAYRIRAEALEASGEGAKAREDSEKAVILGSQPLFGVAVAAVSPDILTRENAALRAFLAKDTPENRAHLASVRNEHATAILELPELNQEALEQALSHAGSASGLQPGNPGYKDQSESLTKELAARHFSRALEDMEAWEGGQENIQKLKSALREAEKATKLNPAAAPYFHLLGYIQTNFQNDPLAAAMAEDALRKALAIQPGNLPSRLLLARLLMNRGAHVQALDAMEECVSKEPALLDSRLAADMCLVYVSAGQTGRGEKFFQGARGLRDSGSARLALALVTRARGRPDEAEKQLAAVIDDGTASKEDVEFARKLSKSWKENKP